MWCIDNIIKLEQWDKALLSAERALELSPETPGVHFNLAMIYFKKEQGPKAVLNMQKAEDLYGRAGQLEWAGKARQNKELIIKVGLPGRQGGDDANRKEFMSYKKILQSHERLHHISHCHGFVDTDRGEGLVCDCIRDSNGDIAKTIWDIVVYQETCNIAEIQEAALTLCNYLIANDLFLFDINLKNIVLKRMQDKSCRAYAIDLKGPFDNKEFLQLSSRIKLLGRKKLKRRSQQLLERIIQFRAQRELLKNSKK